MIHPGDFNGYHVSSAGQLRFMRIDGRRIARTIARELASSDDARTFSAAAPSKGRLAEDLS